MSKSTQDFAVKSKHFSLYAAFKTECERLGWTYDSEFTNFSEAAYKDMDLNSLYFSYEFDACMDEPAFALSSSSEGFTKTFHLEYEFDEALDYARQIIKNTPTDATIRIPKHLIKTVNMALENMRYAEEDNDNFVSLQLDVLEEIFKYKEMFTMLPMSTIKKYKLTDYVID